MFDADTSKLISGAPELDELDLENLSQRFTDAYVSILTARIRLRKLTEEASPPEDVKIISAQMRKIAFANEAFVSVLPDRENRASAAFVAGAAHHVSLMGSKIGEIEKSATKLTHNAIAPEVSATLLFMVAEATSDAAEMSKEIFAPLDSIIEKPLLDAIV